MKHLKVSHRQRDNHENTLYMGLCRVSATCRVFVATAVAAVAVAHVVVIVVVIVVCAPFLLLRSFSRCSHSKQCKCSVSGSASNISINK